MAKNLQFNPQQAFNRPCVERRHRNKQCHYKKFEETAFYMARNRISSVKVYVHIRICQCHFDPEHFPDRSQSIHNHHPKDGTREQNGIEFHMRNDCVWMWIGSDDDHTLKRVCPCGRYASAKVFVLLVIMLMFSYEIFVFGFSQSV